uniref:Uncharacterized protein n=1 Tax=Meleagris gallopavo TaxID=9103 RepID=A0A803YPT2_MELGA
MLHSPHKQPQNHKCGANFLQEDSHYQPLRPTESVKSFQIFAKALPETRGTMASNSLFSSVTPCQQNFFWGKCCATSASDCRRWSFVNSAGFGDGNRTVLDGMLGWGNSMLALQGEESRHQKTKRC